MTADIIREPNYTLQRVQNNYFCQFGQLSSCRLSSSVCFSDDSGNDALLDALKKERVFIPQALSCVIGVR